MAEPTQAKKTKLQFMGAVTGKPPKKKLPWKWIAAGVTITLVLGMYIAVTSGITPRKGSPLYGICRVYIERHLQFPKTFKVVQFEQRIPEGEDPNNIKRLEIDITFSNIDGFGQHRLDTVTCAFKTEDRLANTPWDGILLERVLFNGRLDHGWADIHYMPDKKTPRANDDRSEELEKFNLTIPAILANPPDLTIPWHNLKYMRVEDLQNL